MVVFCVGLNCLQVLEHLPRVLLRRQGQVGGGCFMVGVHPRSGKRLPGCQGYMVSCLERIYGDTGNPYETL